MSPVFERQRVKVEALDRRLRLDSPSVRVDERGLSLDGELALRREDIASVTVSLHERTTVSVRTAKSTGFACTFTDLADANALLEALGRAPERTMTETALEPSLLAAGFATLPWWKTLGMVAIAMVAMVVVLPLLGRALGAASSLGRVLDQTLVLGADGVRIRGRLSNGFLSYREIREVTSRAGAIVLLLRDGTERVLSVSAAARVPEIVAYIERSIARTTVAGDPAAASLLHAVPGTNAEKVAALRELGSETDGSYRDNRIPRERLWGIVEDPQASGATRTRAAIALSGGLADEDRERLRVAVDATVSPKVRVAMDAVQNESDARLAEHLDELPDEEPEQKLQVQ